MEQTTLQWQPDKQKHLSVGRARRKDLSGTLKGRPLSSSGARPRSPRLGRSEGTVKEKKVGRPRTSLSYLKQPPAGHGPGLLVERGTTRWARDTKRMEVNFNLAQFPGVQLQVP